MRSILKYFALIAFGLFLASPLQAAIQNIDIQVGKQSATSSHFVPFTETIENYVVECDCTTLTFKTGGFQVDIDYSKDPAGAFDKTILIQTSTKLIRYHFRGTKIGSPVDAGRDPQLQGNLPTNQKYQYESDFFFTQGCSHCRRLRFVVFPEFQKNHPGLLKINELDIAKEENLLKLLAVSKKLGVQSKTPALQIGDHIFLSEEEIIKGLDLLVNKKIEAFSVGLGFNPSEGDDPALQWNQKDFGLMVMAALIDGVNPCAFATLFFFIAYLNFQKKGRREILILGSAFVIGIYTCYFLIGLGIFHFLLSLHSFFVISKLLTKGFALLALAFALFSFYDVFIVLKTGKTSEMTLQLPTKLKQMIHAIIRGNLKGKP
jgi:thiol-disulfide isomerase/thioredoxin